MWFPECSKLIVNWKNSSNVTIFRHDVIVNFFDVLFLLSSLVTGPSFISISSLALELWQFSFIRDGLEIRKSEIPSSEFFPMSEEWGIPNLARTSLKMLLHAAKCQGYGFYRFWVINGKPVGEGLGVKLPPTQIKR